MSLLATLLATEKPNGNFLPGDINEFYWGAAALLVVVAFLMWKIRPVLAKRMKEAKQKTVDEVSQAQESAKQVESELQEIKVNLEDVNTEKERILATAQINAESLKQELLAKADQDAQDLLSKSLRDIEFARVQAQNEIRQELARTTLAATESIVLESLDSATQTRLFDDYIDANQK